MRLHVLSDIHLEFEPFAPDRTDAEVVVLAGDIGVGLDGVRWAAEAFPRQDVVYVPGNHEYYSHAVPTLTAELLAEGQRLGVHVLSETSVRLRGVRFLGTTLWTDFRLHGRADRPCHEAEAWVSDFHRIRVDPGGSCFRPEDAIRLHLWARQWLASELAASTEPTVVVTHHAPCLRCLAPRYRRDSLSPAFASNLDELVAHGGAALWICGHTHNQSDLVLGATRLVSNQKGYPVEQLEGFDPGLVVVI